MLISNITIVYGPKYPNKAFLVPFLVAAVIVVVLLLNFWHLDKLEGADFKYDLSFSNFSLKILKKSLFGTNLRIFIFAQNFAFS